MTSNPYVPLPLTDESAESSLPLYSKDSHPEITASLYKPALKPASYPPTALNPTPLGKRYMTFKVIWPFPRFERAVVCELGPTQEETVEKLRLALPDILNKSSVKRMNFQIPVLGGWANVTDSDWGDLIVGRTYEEVRVELVLTLRQAYKPTIMIVSIFSVFMFILLGLALTFGSNPNESEK